jgi:lysosomal Pro-X carboxypeptidase
MAFIFLLFFVHVSRAGFDAISQSSHIIFSNGLLDPWHTMGVLKSLSDTLVAVVIPGTRLHSYSHLLSLTRSRSAPPGPPVAERCRPYLR